ncbi:MAG: heparan-alpha-glucosaminide N-acetyltransferase [Anaerolineae bacterium]
MAEQTDTRAARYWEVDALRGVAIILMVLFHLSWDLSFLGLAQIHMSANPWPWFSRIIATTFLSLVGISLTISYARSTRGHPFHKYVLRGLKVFGFGLTITLATYLFIPHEFVVFGILHMIGFSIVAAYLFLPPARRYLSMALGIAFLGVGIYLNRQITTSPWLIWLGIPQIGRPMADWYPVLPWFGLVLLGITAGHSLYPSGVRRFALPDWSSAPVIRQLSFLGRHSLLIYLVHQPVLLAVLTGIAWVSS